MKLTSEALCRDMLAMNKDTISVQAPEIAIKKLVVIIESAMRLSNKKGFQAMSLRDLSKASGVSMGGLYAYFDSKTTLLNMIITQVTKTVEAILGNPPDAVTNDPAAHLSWLIEAHIRMTEKLLPWFIFAYMEAKNFPKAERQMAIDSEELTERYFMDVIQRAMAAQVFRADTSPLLPALIKPLLQDWYVKRSKYRRRGVTVGAYIETVQDFVFRACLPAGALQSSPQIDVANST